MNISRVNVKYYVSCLIVFFIFYRIVFFNPLAFVGYFVGFIGLIYLTFKDNRRFFLNSLGLLNLYCFIFIFLYSFSIDILSGNDFKSLNSLFTVRLLTLLFGSVLSAFFIVTVLGVNSRERLFKILKFCFVLQTIFWFISFVNPNIKIILYSILGQSSSSNLNDFNFLVRGFGFSSEMNFTTPIMMVFISFYYLKNKFFSVVIFLTQIINSNMALLGLIVSYIFNKEKILFKIIIIFVGILGIYFLGETFFPRFYAEYVNGDGLRTITILLNEHVIILSKEWYEYLFGTFRVLFHGADIYRSDIGWILLFNYGGLIYTVIATIYMLSFCFLASKNKRELITLISIVIIANTKGLVLGVNAIIFFLSLLAFINYYEKRD